MKIVAIQILQYGGSSLIQFTDVYNSTGVLVLITTDQANRQI